MIKQENFGTVAGMTLIRSWSDEKMIRQEETGELYSEAIDPDFIARTYTETDVPIVDEEPGSTLPDPEEGESLEELCVPEELIEEEVEGDAEPEDPDGPMPVPAELV